MDASSAERAAELRAEGVPFVHATVVRVQAPAPARAGDDAYVLPDGSICGFVGGQCVEQSIRVAALDVLTDGAAVLLRVLPDGSPPFPDAPGARVVSNPCLSGGALEIFLEPHLPAPVVAVVGESPVAAAVVRLASALGMSAAAMPVPGGEPPHLEDQHAVHQHLEDRHAAHQHAAQAVVVASHGHGEPTAIRAALDAGARYVGLVASARRGAAVVGALGLSDEELSRVHTPAGVDIGACTPEEIGLSIVAEIVKVLRSSGAALSGVSAPTGSAAPSGTAVDPVCGMVVSVGPHTPHRTISGVERWFCSSNCRDTSVA